MVAGHHGQVVGQDGRGGQGLPGPGRQGTAGAHGQQDLFLLGLAESLGSAYVSSAWKDAIAFVVLIVVLLVRPTGILGERVAEKA